MNRQNNVTFWQGHGATRTSYTLLMGMKMGTTALENCLA